MKRAPLLLLLAIGLFPRSASGYPIPPVTLWELVGRAELVVLARVARIERRNPSERADSVWDSEVAVLDVMETWKGAAASPVRVLFSEALICPAPARYVEGETVLAFLERGETVVRRQRAARDAWKRDRAREGACEPPTESEAQEEESERLWEARLTGRWSTVALSYGTLYPPEEEQPVFRELVSKAVKLQARGASESARRDWLLAAAERRATRWHGLYELAATTDALHSFYDPERFSGRRTTLSARELDRVAKGFVKEPSVDGTLPMALAILSGYASADVDRAAASAVEAVLARRALPWWTREAVSAVLARYADPRARARVGLDEPDCPEPGACSPVDLPALAEVWREARRALGIPAVRPAADPPRRVRGVGGETPD